MSLPVYMFQAGQVQTKSHGAFFIGEKFMTRTKGEKCIKSSGWLIDARFKSGTPEYLFGIPHQSGKQFAYILSDSPGNPITNSLLLSHNLSMLDSTELTIYSIKKFISKSPPLTYWLYQDSKHKRPYIKYLGTGDLTVKEEIFKRSDYDFSWEPKKVKTESNQDLAIEYLNSVNPIFTGAKVYTDPDKIPSKCISLYEIYGNNPTIKAAFGSYYIYQEIYYLRSIKSSISPDTWKKVNNLIQGYDVDDELEIEEYTPEENNEKKKNTRRY